MHGLVFETSVYYWQDQPGCYSLSSNKGLSVRELSLPYHLINLGRAYMAGGDVPFRA